MSVATPLPVVVVISGSGSNLQSLIDNAQNINIDIRAVFSDRQQAYGLQRAAAAGIAAQFIDPKACGDREDFDRELARQIDACSPELIVLAGFMRILGPLFVSHFSDRILNIHPSLLPRYRGLHTHRRALEAGDRVHGCSIHVVTDQLDDGPLIAQAELNILPGEDETSLSARVQAMEHKLYPLVIGWIASGRLRLLDGQARLDNEPLSAAIVYAQDKEIR